VSKMQRLNIVGSQGWEKEGQRDRGETESKWCCAWEIALRVRYVLGRDANLGGGVGNGRGKGRAGGY
jgi:hypothetical protein